MANIFIICGLMGVGKTTLAKDIEQLADCVYIDFDEEYHNKIQNRRKTGAYPKIDIPEFINNLTNMINSEKNTDFIIDGWFKWHSEWWKDTEDSTLKEFEDKLKYHKVNVMYLSSPFRDVLKRYKKKKDIGEEAIEAYKKSMKQRQDNLLMKIKRWSEWEE